MLTELGRAPSAFGHTYEMPVLWLENQHGGGVFTPRTIPFRNFRITFGALDGLAGCQIDVMIGRPVDMAYPGPGADPGPRDWQIYDEFSGSEAAAYKNPEDLFSFGRRLQ